MTSNCNLKVQELYRIIWNMILSKNKTTIRNKIEKYINRSLFILISAKTERFLVLKLTKTHTKEFGWMMWQDIIFSSSSIVFISTFYFGFLFYQNATMFLSILWSCGWIQWKTHEIIYDAPKHNQTLPFNFYSHYRFVRSLFDSPIFHYNE